MKHILGQVKDAWASQDLTNSISNFQSFCGLLGLGNLPDFLSANNFQGVQDWSEQQLSSDGRALQASILDRSNVSHVRLFLNYLLTIPSTYRCALPKPCLRRPSRSLTTDHPLTKLQPRCGQMPFLSYCPTSSSLSGTRFLPSFVVTD